MQSQLSPCPICLSDYDRDGHIPKIILNCGHTICSECLITLLQNFDSSRCPLDKRPFCPGKTSLSDFPANFSLLQLLEESTNEGICSEHQERKNLVCMTDRVLVCNSCAIFGEHKGHEMKRTKDFHQILKSKTDQIERALYVLDSHCCKMNSILQKTRASLSDSIKSTFGELHSKLYTVELELLYQSNLFIDEQAEEVYKALRDDVKWRGELARKLEDYQQSFKHHDFITLVEESIQELTSKANSDILGKKTRRFEQLFQIIANDLNEALSLQANLLSKISLPLSNISKSFQVYSDESESESIKNAVKRENIETYCRMVNAQNIKATIDKLLVYLDPSADPLFQNELLDKVIPLIERYKPSPEWYINTMNEVLERGGEHVSSNVISDILKLIEENLGVNPDFKDFLARTYLQQPPKEIFSKIIASIFGETTDRIDEDEPGWFHENSDLDIRRRAIGYTLIDEIDPLAGISSNLAGDEVLNLQAASADNIVNLLDLDYVDQGPVDPPVESSLILQLPSYIGKYTPVNFNVDLYRESWNELSGHVTDDMQSSVKSVEEIKSILGIMNLRSMNGVENEVLGVGEYLSGDLVLLSVKTGSSGIIEFELKSSSERVAKELLQSLKEALRRLFWIL